MSKISKISEILAKYDVHNFSSDCRQREKEAESLYESLRWNWAYKVAKGWYGFDMRDAPVSWLLVIDQFLDYMREVDYIHHVKTPFVIHQVKIKFGGLRFYVECVDNDNLHQQIQELEAALFDKKLSY